ncbi:MAG: glycosyltransferase family 2 protein [Comamonadaceae bacterium]|nr:glycosyltransferase family 2 protein [Comamonadaceae bacterium]
MQNTQVDLSIIVVAWNVKELCDECFRAIAKSTDTLVKEILFVDNGSVDGTADYVEATFPEVILIRSPTNLGFIRANNLAYKQARGKYILMLNSDAFVFEETLQVSVDFMEQHPEAGVMGGRLIGRDGVLQPSARYFPTPFKSFLNQIGLLGKIPFVGVLDDLTWDHQTVRECDWVVGCYLLTRKDIIDRMGYFLREDFFMYNDDNDLCYRIKQLGYKTYYVPTDVIHLGGATAKKNMGKVSKRGTQVVKLQLESQLIYYRKNYHIGTALSSVFSCSCLIFFLCSSCFLLVKTPMMTVSRT